MTSAATNAEPRFSRAAILGACWSVFGILAALFWVMARTEGGPGQTPTKLGLFLFVTLVPLGVTALFGTTILGWIAVSQIRRSVGKLYGMWLAVFDGLFFPLLALDALIGGFWLLLLRVVFNDRLLIPVVGLLALATMVGVDYLIIRRVWRAVNAGTA